VPALAADGDLRQGAEICEITHMLPDKLRASLPEATRMILRRERPHPGAQLSLFEATDGYRYQVLATDTPAGGRSIQYLELRHRTHARVEDRIRAGKNTGFARFPSRQYNINTAWMQMLLLTGPLAAAEPKRLRYQLLHTAGRITRSGRRTWLRLAAASCCYPYGPATPTLSWRATRPSRSDDAPSTQPSGPQSFFTPAPPQGRSSAPHHWRAYASATRTLPGSNTIVTSARRAPNSTHTSTALHSRTYSYCATSSRSTSHYPCDTSGRTPHSNHHRASATSQRPKLLAKDPYLGAPDGVWRQERHFDVAHHLAGRGSLFHSELPADEVRSRAAQLLGMIGGHLDGIVQLGSHRVAGFELQGSSNGSIRRAPPRSTHPFRLRM
jgi:hypothetical protein